MTETLRVLYVEDEPDIRVVAEFALGDQGFELTPCESGRQALERAAECSPDLLLLDVMMPEMDGPTTLQKLRELPGYADTPAIFMTAKVQPHEIEQYRQIGALDVIPKPFDPMGLGEKIRSILARANG